MPFKWAVESFITLNKHRFTVKHLNQRYKFWLILPVRARPEFYDDGVQICVKKISRVISIKTVAMSQTLIEVGEIFFIQSTAARHAGKIEQVALCCLVYLPSWIPLEQIYSSLAAGVRARQCRFVIASTTVVQSRWFPSSTHTPYAVPIAIPGKPANPLVFNINKGMTLWPFDGFPDGPTKKKKVYIHCWWQIFHQCNPAPNWFQYNGVYTSCFNHNWCKLLRLALKIPVESFG